METLVNLVLVGETVIDRIADSAARFLRSEAGPVWVASVTFGLVGVLIGSVLP